MSVLFGIGVLGLRAANGGVQGSSGNRLPHPSLKLEGTSKDANPNPSIALNPNL